VLSRNVARTLSDPGLSKKGPWENIDRKISRADAVLAKLKEREKAKIRRQAIRGPYR